jgi:hypothetical protein
MKKHTAWIAALLCLLVLTGCRAAPDSGSEGSKTSSIPFQEDQLYAVAYLGYGEINDLAFYTENYLDDVNLPVHYLSKGDYYLIIPRYAEWSASVPKRHRDDGDYPDTEEMACRPYILQCNNSDISRMRRSA